jgi:hypothetical protein
MRRRWRLLLSAALVLAVAGAFHSFIYWTAYGLFKGEAFYQGKPTSWWVADLSTYRRTGKVGDFGHNYLRRDRSINLSERLELWWIAGQSPLRLTEAIEFPALLRNRDLSALPVLLEMLRSDRAIAREVACCGLGKLGSHAKSVLRDLSVLADEDPDPLVRSAAQWAVLKIEAEPLP